MEIDKNPLTGLRPKINPYRSALGAIWYRLVWDLNLKSWISRKRLQDIRNEYAGQKCVILCNGPSLLNVDFDFLNNHEVFTIGLNKVNLLFTKFAFRPNCVVAVNEFVLRQNREFYNETEIPLYLSSISSSFIKQRKNVTFLHATSLRRFAMDCSMSVVIGGTVTFVAMQMAYHMGFKEVALVGCDHNFQSTGPANTAVRSEEVDKSHFDPDYFSKGVVWQLPDLPQSEFYYHVAKNVFEANGRKIYNATEGGKLEVYPRIHLKDFLLNA